MGRVGNCPPSFRKLLTPLSQNIWTLPPTVWTRSQDYKSLFQLWFWFFRQLFDNLHLFLTSQSFPVWIFREHRLLQIWKPQFCFIRNVLSTEILSNFRKKNGRKWFFLWKFKKRPNMAELTVKYWKIYRKNHTVSFKTILSICSWCQS